MEEKDLKITAIIKTYNCEDYLCNTLEAIKDFDEIIIVDENSTDDTVEIAKEYKAKIIYANKNELYLGINQAIDEAQGSWVFLLEDKEIIPQKLISKIQNYIENPKKNKFSISFNQKYFYLNKEIKAARKKNVLRLFKKGYCELKNDFSIELKLKKGKIQKLQDCFKVQSACILAFSKNDIITSTINIMELNKNTLKSVTNKPSVFLKPICTFLYWYFIKKAIFEGRAGFIYSTKKYFEKFLLEVMLLEKRSRK